MPIMNRTTDADIAELPGMIATSEPLLGAIGERFVYEIWQLAEGDFQVGIVGLHDDTDELIDTCGTYEEAAALASKHAEEQFGEGN
jgi:hypothetical protein